MSLVELYEILEKEELAGIFIWILSKEKNTIR